jgi:hypothetical protein
MNINKQIRGANPYLPPPKLLSLFYFFLENIKTIRKKTICQEKNIMLLLRGSAVKE